MQFHPLDPYFPPLHVQRRAFQLGQELADARAAHLLMRDALDCGDDLLADPDDVGGDDAASELRFERYREIEPILAMRYDILLRDLLAFQAEHAL